MIGFNICVNLCQQVVKVISDRLLVIQIRLCISDVCYGDCQVPSEVRLWMMTVRSTLVLSAVADF